MTVAKRETGEVRRPILRYHGGKWMLGPWIIEHLPSHRTYVEPYGGAASVLLRKKRSYAEVYNDLDGEIVNLFRVVRDNGEALRDIIRLTPFARAEYAASMTTTGEPLEDARRLVIRSFMGFGSDSFNPGRKSGFRSNSNRSATTPAHDWAHFPDALDGMIERLRGVVIENKPAAGVIAQHDNAQTVFYCDPPYVHATRMPHAHSKGCYRHEMTDDDHREFAAVIRAIKGMAVISGYRSALYEDLFGDWQTVERAALADGARARTEVLWFNPAAWTQLNRDKGLF